MGNILKQQEEIEEVQYSVWYHQRHQKDEMRGLRFAYLDMVGGIVLYNPFYFFGKHESKYTLNKFWRVVRTKKEIIVINLNGTQRFHISKETFEEIKEKYGAFV